MNIELDMEFGSLNKFKLNLKIGKGFKEIRRP
jgi:hypothetical protein